jgi:hypothetical protein
MIDRGAASSPIHIGNTRLGKRKERDDQS